MSSTDKFLPAKILDCRTITHDLFILRVEVNGTFSYLPGQYATIGIELHGKHLERPYSICSSPHENILEFFIELVPHGEFTPYLDKLEKGSTLLLRRVPKGRFNLDLRGARKNHLLLATVTGIAPYVSYIRTLWADWKKGATPTAGDHHLYCIHGASRSWEFGYSDEIRHYASEAPWLKYVPTVSRPWEDIEWKGEHGRVDDLIRKYVHEWSLRPADTTAYLCGHPNMVENGRGILQRAGWPKDALREELYFPSRKEAAGGIL